MGKEFGSNKSLETESSKASNLGLEEIVHIANKVGLEFVEAKKNAEYYSLMKPTMKAKIMMRLDDGNLSEAKLLRMTETDSEYIEFLEKLSNAKREADKLKVRYESYKNLFEAKRSVLSYKKTEMSLL